MVDEKQTKGFSTDEAKGVVVPPEDRCPYTPEYGKMSKKDFIAAEEKRLNIKNKTAAYKKSLENDTQDEAPAAETTTSEAPPAPKKKKTKK